MSIDILAGDFAKGSSVEVTRQGAWLISAGDGLGWRGQKLPLTRGTATLTIASEDTAKRFMRSMGLATVGALAVGLPGLLAGALAGGNKKTVTFILELSDGRRALASTDAKTFAAFQTILF
jgi:hypothetical protein